MPTRRAFIRNGAAVAGVITTAGCSGDGVASKSRIKITENGFDPRNTRIAEADALFWENTSDSDHQVVSVSRNWSFESETFGPGKAISYSFQGTGVYDAVCGVHSSPEEFPKRGMRIAVGLEEEMTPLGD